MRHKTIARVLPVLLAGSYLLSLPARAQEPESPSVAEAARRAREQKNAASKPAHIITDDTLHPPGTNAAPPPEASQGAEATTPDGNTAATPAPSPSEQGTAPAAEDAEAKKKAIDALKQEIAQKQSEVDLAQRELVLANDDYYSKPDFQSDTTGKAKLESLQTDLNTKKDELAQLQAKLTELGVAEEPKPQPKTPAVITGTASAEHPAPPPQP